MKVYIDGNLLFAEDDQGVLPLNPSISTYGIEDGVFTIWEYGNMNKRKSVKVSELEDGDGALIGAESDVHSYMNDKINFKAVSGGSETGTPFKYIATDYTELITTEAPEAEDGDLAYVYNSSGVWPLNRRIRGVYLYIDGAWEYGAQELQDIVAAKVDSIDGNIVDNTNPLRPLVNESITSLSISGNELTYLDEEGNNNLVTIPKQSSFIHNSGRFTSYTNGRWITDSDDQYGTNFHQLQEGAGSQSDPIFEWEHMGVPLPSGVLIEKLLFNCRSNNIQTSDFELVVVERKPKNSDGWKTGVDADNEMKNTIIYRDTYSNSVGIGGVSFSGAMNDMHSANIPINHTTTADCMLSIYIKPIENNVPPLVF